MATVPDSDSIPGSRKDEMDTDPYSERVRLTGFGFRIQITFQDTEKSEIDKTRIQKG
jgi:hypothetical protein